MDKFDWRFEVMNAIRISFREKITLENLKKKIDEIYAQKKCIEESSESIEEN